MVAYNFVYDNIPLSDFGLILCAFSGPSMETVSLGSQISFELGTVPGKEKRNFISNNYQETITSHFQAAKIDPKTKTPYELSQQELSYIVRWLNRQDGFYKFKLIQDEFEILYTYANFNVSKIEIAGKIIGIDITMYTMYPYLLEEQSDIVYDIPSSGTTIFLMDNSDRIGHINLDVKIECLSNGEFSFYNSREKRITTINNCQLGEIITIDGDNQIIESSYKNHDIQDDFNYRFPRIVNTFYDRQNEITIGGINCVITLSWSPIRKVGF